MNQTLENIRNRRSVRSYSKEQLSEEEVNAIIEAGLYAPSANNQQSWHFTVIQDKKLLRDLNYETKAILAESDNPFLRRVGNNEELDIFNDAPTVIVVSGNEANESSAVECAMASQNMLLAAQSIGISSCYIISISYLFDGSEKEYFMEKLGIPKRYKVQNAILLGYGIGEVPNAAPRKEDSVNYIR